MLYTLDGKVIYDPINGTLLRPDEKMADATHLTTLASKILHHLVLHHGELVTRDTLVSSPTPTCLSPVWLFWYWLITCC